MEVWSIVLIVLLLFLFFWLNVPSAARDFFHKWRHVRRLPVFRKPHWFWGNVKHINPDNPTLLTDFAAFVQTTRPRIIQAWFGPFFAVVGVHHCDVIKKLLKEPKSRPAYRMLLPWLGEGLLVADGARWFRNRRLLTPAFHYEILKSYIPVYGSCVQVLVNKWSAAASQNEPVKLFDSISLLSLDIVLQCAFSYKSNCQNVRLRHPYIKAVYDLAHLVVNRFLTPVYHIDWIYYLTPSGRKTREACRIVHEFSSRVIRERKKALELDGRKKESAEIEALHQSIRKQGRYLDFLDILLTTMDEDGNGLTDLEIRNEADTFMFEGHDTTTSGICWTLYCLAKHPEHQEKVREEVRNVLMGRDWLEYDDLKDLKYTQWCIKEAMRLYPPVLQIFRKATEDIEFNGYVIPKGIQLNIVLYTLHRHPDIWENPEEYDPLRFHPSNTEKRDPFAYMPFSAGSRNCIGQNFAINEERVVVAMVVNNFSLSLVEDHEVVIVPKLILRTRDDIKVKLQPLQ